MIDPTVEVVKKLCINLRKNAKDERVLFHYNGHGVPKPTDAGEIWVFNKNITQVILLIKFMKLKTLLLFNFLIQIIFSIFLCRYMICNHGWVCLLYIYGIVIQLGQL